MSALFAGGHVVNQTLHCRSCGLDTIRQGACTEPSCSWYGVKS